MKKLLHGKVCVITGVSGDIGSSVAELFASEGAKVIGTYNKNREKALATVGKAEKQGLSIDIIKVDVSRENDVKRFFERLDRLDVLVNAAGHSDKRVWFSKPEQIKYKDWIEVLSIDLVGLFSCCREAAKIMLSTKAGGSIVNFSSAAGITGHTEGFPYTAAKAGVAALTKSLAYYYGPEIRVNAVAPGNINAGSIRWYDGKGKRLLANESALRRLGRADEVAKAVLFLASDMSSFINGQTILVDGGI
jgi:Dehydrogenases with different specificities (related to short-chain alcohol dehydrogenases)